MGKASNKARAKRHKLANKLGNSGSNGRMLKCFYWNANGMQCLCKQQELIDLMEIEQLDIVMVDETQTLTFPHSMLIRQFLLNEGLGKSMEGGK